MSEFLFSLTTSCNIHFILISSYIASTSKYNISKQLPLIIETVFYSLFLYFASIYFFKFKKYNYETFLYYLFPVANRAYWYTGPFLLSGLICSLIYPTIKSQSKKFHFFVICIIFFLYSIQFVGYYTKLGLYTHTYSSFLVISIIGSFFRFHKPNISIFYLIIIFILIAYYKYYTLCHHTNSIHWYIRIFWLKDILQPPTILFGIASFLIAIKVNIETKIDYYIQKISELSYPIYLIHLHDEIIHLWQQPLIKLSRKNLVYYWKNNLHMSLKVYVTCALIEILRKKIFKLFLYERNVFAYINSCCNKVTT